MKIKFISIWRNLPCWLKKYYSGFCEFAISSTVGILFYVDVIEKTIMICC